MKTLRPELEPLPARLQVLPVARGYPVPWFVAWIDGGPEFRMVEAGKRDKAIIERRCWVCGDHLGRYMTFVLGPMCGINRTSAEPPCHLECAQWSARNCPFLSRPNMERREDEFTAQASPVPGFMIRRNPGVTLLWTTRSYDLFDDGKGGVLLSIGDPTCLEWYAKGRPATRDEVVESVLTGLPILTDIAAQEGPDALLDLERRATWLESQYPPLKSFLTNNAALMSAKALECGADFEEVQI